MELNNIKFDCKLYENFEFKYEVNSKEVEFVVVYFLGIFKISGLYLVLEDMEVVLIMNGRMNGYSEDIVIREVFFFVELRDFNGVLLLFEIIY